MLDEKLTTPERMVLYYRQPLAAGATSPNIMTAFRIDNDVALSVSRTTSGGNVTTEYQYDGVTFGLDVAIDGIQARNAQEAITSVWGSSVSVGADGGLSIN